MDAESQQSTQDAWSADHVDAVSSSSRHSGSPISQCTICRRAFFPEAEAVEGLEAIPMCRHCKAMVLDGGETGVSSPRRRHRQRGGSRHRSSESIEDLFSHQFSQLISFARQSQVDGDDANSNISVGGSDASVNGYSLFDNESDTDIDPMRTGLDGWISDDGFSDDDPLGSVERFFFRSQIRDANPSPNRSQASFYYRSGDEELEVISRYTLDLGDDIDTTRFDELMENFLEAIGRGQSSMVVKLPDVMISEEIGSLVCAVCKDPMPIYSTAKQLPCRHLYHPSCILPWLNVRRTCPVCRYELPAEDLEYEEAKYHEEEIDDVLELGDNGPWSIRGGARRWMLLAAAPIVGFVGMAIVFWLQSQRGDRPRVRWNAADRNQRSRNRKWWSLI